MSITDKVRSLFDDGACSVLDVGCGPGTYLHSVPDGCTRFALDAYTPYLASVRSDGKLDGTAQTLLPVLRDQAFDVVMALDFVEHLEKRSSVAVIREMQRIARRKVAVFTPNGFRENQSLHVHADDAKPWQTHRSGWSQPDLSALGFDVEVLDFAYVDKIEPAAALWAVWRRP